MKGAPLAGFGQRPKKRFARLLKQDRREKMNNKVRGFAV